MTFESDAIKHLFRGRKRPVEKHRRKIRAQFDKLAQFKPFCLHSDF